MSNVGPAEGIVPDKTLSWSIRGWVPETSGVGRDWCTRR
jgi:hypothetical protein